MLTDGADEHVSGIAVNVNNRVVASNSTWFSIAASFQANLEAGLRQDFPGVTVHISLTQLGTTPAPLDLSDNALLLMLIRLPSYNVCLSYAIGSHGVVLPMTAYALINGAY